MHSVICLFSFSLQCLKISFDICIYFCVSLWDVCIWLSNVFISCFAFVHDWVVVIWLYLAFRFGAIDARHSMYDICSMRLCGFCLCRWDTAWSISFWTPVPTKWDGLLWQTIWKGHYTPHQNGGDTTIWLLNISPHAKKHAIHVWLSREVTLYDSYRME